MQLTNTNKGADNHVRARLSMAVLTVLGAVQGHAGAQTDPNAIEVDTAVMRYQESGGRVKTTEGVLHAKKNFEDGSSVGVKLTFDTLSGGSPNGALPSNKTQTFARPSGSSLSSSTAPTQTCTSSSGKTTSCSGSSSGPYTVAPGALPVDSSFKDERFAGALDWSLPITPLTNLALGGSYSHELDFQSLSASALVSRDFNEKNTTLSLGVNVEADQIAPIGGAPVPLSDYAAFQKDGNQKKKSVADLLVGVSQIINRRWITQVNYSLDKSSGYQNDPYKIVSGLTAAGDTYGYMNENRPTDRTRNSIYWGNKFAFDHDTVDFSYRHMTDNWGVRSDTFDVHYRWMFSDNAYIEPQLRYYKQTAADFFHFYKLQGTPFLQYVSADPRLAKFNANTIGIKVGAKLDRNSDVSLRYQMYKQTGNGPDVVPAALQGLNLYPGLKAQVLELNFKMSF